MTGRRADDELADAVRVPAREPALDVLERRLATARLAADPAHHLAVSGELEQVVDVFEPRLPQQRAAPSQASGTITVRSNSITTTSSWFRPRVRTVTIPWPGPRVRLALLEHLRLRADRVAREHGRRQRHVAPAEVDRLLRDVDDRQARDERERERRVDERAAPLGRRGIGASKWIGFVFKVSSVNQTLSASSTVRPNRLR